MKERVMPEKGHVSKSRKARIEALERENQELRQRIGMDAPLDLTVWEMVNTQEMRDALAVRALIQEWGDPYKALMRLGFQFKIEPNGAIGKEDREHVRALIKRIFETDGVKTIYAKAFEDVEALKPEIINRQAQIALYGDDESSVRAASQLAKVAGWNKPDPDSNKMPVINLYNFMAPNGHAQVRASVNDEPQAIPAASGFLDHEPGEPVRIDSGDDQVYEALEKRK